MDEQNNIKTTITNETSDVIVKPGIETTETTEVIVNPGEGDLPEAGTTTTETTEVTVNPDGETTTTTVTIITTTEEVVADDDVPAGETEGEEKMIFDTSFIQIIFDYHI